MNKQLCLHLYTTTTHPMYFSNLLKYFYLTGLQYLKYINGNSPNLFVVYFYLATIIFSVHFCLTTHFTTSYNNTGYDADEKN